MYQVFTLNRQWAQAQKKSHGRNQAFVVGIKRDSVFEDTIEILRNSPIENLMHKLSAHFLGEDGTDQGTTLL